MLKAVQKLRVTELQAHYWQKNIPDMKDNDWDEFLEDVRENGIQHPITVSTRIGDYVIVDGHQRVRAAKEVELRQIDAIVKPFQDEISEITFIVGANKRRHLSDVEKVRIARELEKEFAKEAEIKQKSGKKVEDLGLNSAQGSNTSESKDDRKSTTKAAKVVDLKRDKFQKGKKILDEAPEPVRAAWEREEISTHAAHKLTMAAKVDSELYEALSNEEITPSEALEELKAREKTKEVIDNEEKESRSEKETSESTQDVTEQAEETGEAEESTDDQEDFEEIANNTEDTEEDTELARANSKIKELEQTISELEQQIENLNQALQAEKDTWLKQNAQQTQEMLELRKQLNQKDEQIKELQEAISTEAEEAEEDEREIF